MNKPSSDLDARIIELWFQGLSRDQIARKLNVSQGKVSSAISYLPSCLEPLRDLSKTLRKLNLLPQDTLEGIKVMQQLKELGLTEDQALVFIQSIKRVSAEAGYKPEEVIQGAIKLAILESQAGKPYQEALKDFESKINQNKQIGEKIKKRKQQLSETIVQIKANTQQRNQTLEQANRTAKEIAHVNDLETKLGSFGVNLEDAEELLQYLENMKEIGQDPKRFVLFTKEFGSIKRHIFDLNAQKQEAQKSLSFLRNEIEIEATKQDKILEEHEKIMIQIRDEISSIQKEKAQENEELTQKKNQVDTTNIQLTNLRNAVTDAELRKQESIRETESILGIQNYALEYKGAIATLETNRLSLQEELEAKENKIVFATVVTDFLTTQPDILFDSFYLEVQRIKEIRENPTSPLKLALPDLTDALRSKALEAIKGNPRFTVINNF